MGATFSKVKTVIAGETITASDRNAEFDNILNNLDPSGIDDQSSNATAMQATADPYPGGSVSLATNLTGELQRFRYQILQLLKALDNTITYWYEDAPSAGSIVTLTGTQTLTNKTLTTPTIGDFTNANHDHSNAANGGGVLFVKAGTVLTAEATTSTSYVNLATTGPQVTFTLPASMNLAFFLSSQYYNNTANAKGYTVIDIDGADKTTETEVYAEADGTQPGNNRVISTVGYIANVASGSHTVTMQYKVSTGTGIFLNRRLVVLAFAAALDDI